MAQSAPAMAQTIEAYVGETMDAARMGPVHWQVLALVASGYFFDVLDFTIFGALVPDLIKAPYSRTAMACPDAPVELIRVLAAAAPTAALTAEGPSPITSTSVAIYRVFHLDCGGAPPIGRRSHGGSVHQRLGLPGVIGTGGSSDEEQPVAAENGADQRDQAQRQKYLMQPLDELEGRFGPRLGARAEPSMEE